VPHTRVNGVSVARALSKLGLASRAQAAALIEQGRVRIDGRIETDPGRFINPDRARIQVDGIARDRARWRLVALNKPRQVVTTRRDPQDRTTVYDLLKDLDTRVVPVGRLDYASNGLLLFTSDTRLADWLTDPGTGIVRRYVVTVRGELSDGTIRALEAGVVDRGETLKADRVVLLKRSKRETHMIVELTEGRNREIRRMMQRGRHEVTRLTRIAFGGLELGGLAPGKWREVSLEEARAAFPGAPIRRRG
jgi:23S rRNA pseudouridine2605 synthase